MRKSPIDNKIKKRGMSRGPSCEPGNRSGKGLVTVKKVETMLLALIFFGLAALVFVGPFQRGLFFTYELLHAQVLVFGLLVAWGIFRILAAERRLINTPLEVCLFLLLAAYLLSFPGAVNRRDALEETMKVAMYLVVFLVTVDICRYWKLIPKRLASAAGEETDLAIPPGLILVLHLLLASSTVVTVASIGAAIGHFNFPGAYFSNRIASPMGYANTAAAYLMAAYLLAICLAPLARRSLKRVLYLAPAALMILTLVLTYSRGAWILMPPLALLGVLLSAPGERLRTLLYIALTALTAVPAAFIVDPLLRSETPVWVWVPVIAVALVAPALGLLAEFYLGLGPKIKIRIGAAVVSAALVVALILVLAPILSPLHLAIPPGEQGRIEKLDQVIENVLPGQAYTLSLQVRAERHQGFEENDLPYVWGVRVAEGPSDYLVGTVFNELGEETDGWEERIFEFETAEETRRMEISVYIEHPGTSVTVRDVALNVEGRQDKQIRFALNRILPESLYDRLFYSRDENVDRRLEIYRDALKIIRDYPLRGTGGGGWAALYFGYQEHAYNSMEVHNHFLKVLLEAGILGFLAFTGIWVSLAIAFYRNCAGQAASRCRRQLWAAAFVPVAALGAHSIIDWNFSLGAVGIFLFALLAAGRSLDQKEWGRPLELGQEKTAAKSTAVGVSAILLGLVLIILTLNLIGGARAAVNSVEMLHRGNAKLAVHEMHRAIERDPLRADNYYNLSVVLEEQMTRTNNPNLLPDMVFLAQKAHELEPFNPTYFLRYGHLLLNTVGVDEGLEQIDRIVDVRPYYPNSYSEYSWPRLNVAEFLVGIGHYRQAELLLNEIIQIEQLMLERLGSSREIYYPLGRAHFLLQNFDLARAYLEEIKEDDPSYELGQETLRQVREAEQGER